MQRTFVALATLCGLIVAWAGAAEEPIIIPGIADPRPVIDGNLQDWANKGALVEIKTAEQVSYNGAAWKGPEDLSGWVRFGHDDKYLFAACHVVDNFVIQHSSGVEVWRGDHVMLGAMRSPSEVGFYSAAMRLADTLLFIPELLLLTLFPMLSSYAKTEARLFRSTYATGFAILAWLFVPLPVIMPLVSNQVITLLFGPEFYPSSAILDLLAWPVLLSVFSPILYSIMVVENTQKHLLWLVIPMTLLNIALNYLLIPRLGYIGACWARIISTAAGAIGYLFIPSVRGYFLAALRGSAKPALATLLLAGYVSVSGFPELTTLMTGVILYLISLLLLTNSARPLLKGIIERLR